MELQSFINQVIREICLGALAAGSTPPQIVEMDIALTKDGKVCSRQEKAAGRVSLKVSVAKWPSAATKKEAA